MDEILLPGSQGWGVVENGALHLHNEGRETEWGRWQVWGKTGKNEKMSRRGRLGGGHTARRRGVGLGPVTPRPGPVPLRFNLQIWSCQERTGKEFMIPNVATTTNKVSTWHLAQGFVTCCRCCRRWGVSFLTCPQRWSPVRHSEWPSSVGQEPTHLTSQSLGHFLCKWEEKHQPLC